AAAAPPTSAGATSGPYTPAIAAATAPITRAKAAAATPAPIPAAAAETPRTRAAAAAAAATPAPAMVVAPPTPNSQSAACDKCDKVFDIAASLAKHAVAHSDYQCSHCGKRTKDDAALQKHLWAIHPICVKALLAGDVNEEIEKHYFEEPMVNEKETLKRDTRASRGEGRRSERKVKCDQCEWSFDKPSQLDAHKRTHNDLRQLQEGMEVGDMESREYAGAENIQ
ncbi:hypothetical protein PFISCL1PPCAC_22625, partial [Pristionchus fissidentatus]